MARYSWIWMLKTVSLKWAQKCRPRFRPNANSLRNRLFKVASLMKRWTIQGYKISWISSLTSNKKSKRGSMRKRITPSLHSNQALFLIHWRLLRKRRKNKNQWGISNFRNKFRKFKLWQIPIVKFWKFKSTKRDTARLAEHGSPKPLF